MSAYSRTALEAVRAASLRQRSRNAKAPPPSAGAPGGPAASGARRWLASPSRLHADAGETGHSADAPDVPLNWPRPDRGASTSLRRAATGATGTRAQFWGCSPRPAALGPPEASPRGLPAAACRALTWSPFVGTSLASPHASKPPLLRRTPVKLD